VKQINSVEFNRVWYPVDHFDMNRSRIDVTSVFLLTAARGIKYRECKQSPGWFAPTETSLRQLFKSYIGGLV
jgi:hypothetical protein